MKRYSWLKIGKQREKDIVLVNKGRNKQTENYMFINAATATHTYG
jgi:hypothetical protein